ncbi:MAG: radical SAM/SPASM domain-containing protein, partial [bacterium]|nr:radical SAM/SPASM domain-containing protein [bacterium]
LVKQLGFPVVIMFTLLKRNVEEAKFVIDFAKKHLIDGIIFERFIPLGQSKPLVTEIISGKELDGLYRYIFNQCDLDYNPDEMVKYRALQLQFEDDLVHPTVYGAECIVGKDGMAILPDGTVLPCRRFNLPIGNLLETPLVHLWQNSDVLLNIRNKKNYKGKCSSCTIPDCFGCRAMTYALTGDKFAEDPHCWICR